MARKKNFIIYIPFIASLVFLGVMIYSDYFFLFESEAWISFLPLIIFLIIFAIIETKKKIFIEPGEN